VLFVRGVGSVSYLWRHVIDQLAGQRRCVAFDLPLHGRIPAAADQDFSLPGLARIGPRFVRDIPLTSLHARDLLAIEPALARLQVPTLIVWGTGDTAFHRKWAYWLRDTIPGATDVIEIDGARLFFPDERATEFTAALRRHWDNHP
jgi:pimeloyl-ACP methyl ester carboxylesterase